MEEKNIFEKVFEKMSQNKKEVINLKTYEKHLEVFEKIVDDDERGEDEITWFSQFIHDFLFCLDEIQEGDFKSEFPYIIEETFAEMEENGWDYDDLEDSFEEHVKEMVKIAQDENRAEDQQKRMSVFFLDFLDVLTDYEMIKKYKTKGKMYPHISERTFERMYDDGWSLEDFEETLEGHLENMAECAKGEIEAKADVKEACQFAVDFFKILKTL